MIALEFYGFLLLALVLSLICTALYVRFCAVVANWVDRRYGDRLRSLFPNSGFPNVGEQSRNTRKESNVDVCYIYKPNKIYKWFYAKFFGILWMFRKVIRKMPIYENCQYQNEDGDEKGNQGTLKYYLHYPVHLVKKYILGKIKKSTKNERNRGTKTGSDFETAERF